MNAYFKYSKILFYNTSVSLLALRIKYSYGSLGRGEKASITAAIDTYCQLGAMDAN